MQPLTSTWASKKNVFVSVFFLVLIYDTFESVNAYVHLKISIVNASTKY